jgi:hypothetical protein
MAGRIRVPGMPSSRRTGASTPSKPNRVWAISRPLNGESCSSFGMTRWSVTCFWSSRPRARTEGPSRWGGKRFAATSRWTPATPSRACPRGVALGRTACSCSELAPAGVRRPAGAPSVGPAQRPLRAMAHPLRGSIGRRTWSITRPAGQSASGESANGWFGPQMARISAILGWNLVGTTAGLLVDPLSGSLARVKLRPEAPGGWPVAA